MQRQPDRDDGRPAARGARHGEAAGGAGREGSRPQKKKPGDAARKMRAMFKG